MPLDDLSVNRVKLRGANHSGCVVFVQQPNGAHGVTRPTNRGIE
jgi:hypothetical protein